MADLLINTFWKIVNKSDNKRISAQSAPLGVEKITDVDYWGDGGKYHLLDIYRPENDNAVLPVIIDIHGGGWYYGDKDLNKYYCMSLVKYGFAVVSVSYTLAGKATVFDQIKECAAAVNYICDNADKYKIDKNNVFVTGDSAGGHLTAMMAKLKTLSESEEVFGTSLKCDIRGVCYTCAALDISSLASKPGMGLYFNSMFGKKYRRDSRIKYLDFSYAFENYNLPSYFISAYGDFIKKQTLYGYKKVKDKNLPCGITYFDKNKIKEHKLIHVFNVLYPEWEESAEANKGMCDFFKALIK